MAFFFSLLAKQNFKFLVFWCNKWPIISQILLKLWLIGNRTSCRPIRSVIILVIKQIGLPLRGRPILLITRMITDWIGLHSVLLPLLIKLLFSGWVSSCAWCRFTSSWAVEIVWGFWCYWRTTDGSDVNDHNQWFTSEQMQSINQERGIGWGGQEEDMISLWFYTYQAMRQEDVLVELAAIVYMNQKVLVEIRIVE